MRSGSTLPPDVSGHAGLAVIEASLLSLSDDELRRHLVRCDAVVSCLGHVLSLGGVFGPPRDLVTRATTRLCRGIEVLEPTAPVKLILMSSVSVHRPRGLSAPGLLQRGRFSWGLCGVLPPPATTSRRRTSCSRRSGPDNAFVH
ncbi:MAG: hypothetical protein IPF66_14280 [Holophagales bacterium]|nr:hypothetical protein [Holophagales bacterium]